MLNGIAKTLKPDNFQQARYNTKFLDMLKTGFPAYITNKEISMNIIKVDSSELDKSSGGKLRKVKKVSHGHYEYFNSGIIVRQFWVALHEPYDPT